MQSTWGEPSVGRVTYKTVGLGHWAQAGSAWVPIAHPISSKVPRPLSKDYWEISQHQWKLTLRLSKRVSGNSLICTPYKRVRCAFMGPSWWLLLLSLSVTEFSSAWVWLCRWWPRTGGITTQLLKTWSEMQDIRPLHVG